MELQDAFKKIQSNYIIQLLENLDEVEELVLELEKGSLKEKQKEYRELQGIIHSIKGSAGTFELNLITTICHNYEDHLSTLGDGEFKHISEFSLAVIDFMKEYANAFLKEGNSNIDSYNKRMDSFFVCEFNPGGVDAPAVRRPRFLINDNYNIMSKIISGVLGKHNLESHFSRTGFEALDRIIGENFTGLITSFDTPRIDGVKLAKMVRVYKENDPDFKIFLITSKNLGEIPEVDFIINKNQDVETNLSEKLATLF